MGIGCSTGKAIEIDVQGALTIANSIAETALTNYSAWKQVVPVYKNALRRWMAAAEADDLVKKIDNAQDDNKGSLLMALTSLSPSDENNFLRCCSNYLYPNDPTSQSNWQAIGRALLAVSRAVVVRAPFLTHDETKRTDGLKELAKATKKAKTVDDLLEKLPCKEKTYKAIDYVVKSNNRRKTELVLQDKVAAKVAAERKPSIVSPKGAAKAVGGAVKAVGGAAVTVGSVPVVAVRRISSATSNVVKAAIGKGAKAAEAATDKAGEAVEKTADVAEKATGAAAGVASKATGAAAGVASKATGAAAGAAVKVASKATGAAAGVASKATSAVKGQK